MSEAPTAELLWSDRSHAVPFPLGAGTTCGQKARSSRSYVVGLREVIVPFLYYSYFTYFIYSSILLVFSFVFIFVFISGYTILLVALSFLSVPRRTSRLGFAARQSDEIRRGSQANDASLAAGIGVNERAPAERREACVVLVDRTLDLAAAASKGGSLLQRVSHPRPPRNR